jgi:SnoaL-like domain
VTHAGDQLLHAFANSDLGTIERLCAEDVLLVGTDRDEVWRGRESVLTAFACAFDLQVRWLTEPESGDGWLFGVCAFMDEDGAETPARVTMVFRDGLLAHAHYSVAR